MLPQFTFVFAGLFGNITVSPAFSADISDINIVRLSTLCYNQFHAKKEVLILKYITEFLAILAISFIGELLHALIPLPVPASIYGLVLMLAALISGVLKLEMIENAAQFLIDIMAVMFIPAAVGLIEQWGSLRSFLVPAAVITVLVTVIVLAVTGRVTQRMIRIEKKKKGDLSK